MTSCANIARRRASRVVPRGSPIPHGVPLLRSSIPASRRWQEYTTPTSVRRRRLRAGTCQLPDRNHIWNHRHPAQCPARVRTVRRRAAPPRASPTRGLCTGYRCTSPTQRRSPATVQKRDRHDSMCGVQRGEKERLSCACIASASRVSIWTVGLTRPCSMREINACPVPAAWASRDCDQPSSSRRRRTSSPAVTRLRRRNGEVRLSR